MDEVITDQNTVTINIPTDAVSTARTVVTSEEQKQTLETPSVASQQTEQQMESNKDIKEPVKDPNRNEKGQFVQGHDNMNKDQGRPCLYCEKKEELQKIADDYLLEYQLKSVTNKPEVPWLEELCLKLHISEQTLSNWINKRNENNEPEHPNFIECYTSLKLLQKMLLKKRSLGRFNPRGALYLLNADHKVIETTREEHSGTDNSPIEIRIVEEKKHAE